jgi:hypothetical protein
MVRSPRRLGDKSAGAGGYRIRGDPEPGRRRYRGADEAGQPGELANRHRRRMRDSRRLEATSPVEPEMQNLGQPGGSSEALRRKWRTGATRNSMETGSAGGCEIRGNPKIHRRHSQWTEDSGRPEDSSPVRQMGAEYGATRKRRPGQAGRCRMRGDSQPHQKAERDDA